MKKRLFWLGGILVVILLVVWITAPDTNENQEIYVYPEYGDFIIDVTTTGELEAKNSQKIYGPQGLRQVRIWNVKIEDIIPDGTVVDSGEYVATLDRSELTNNLKDQEISLETLESQLIKTRLDTSMTLRNARDELVNLKYSVEERQIEVDQSIYEPPATKRQVKINLDKATRSLEQAIKNYDLKKQKADAEMVEVNAKYRKAETKYNKIVDVLGDFSIFAPKSGMVIYKRDWDGKKIGVGGQISAWDPVVATLPDLTSMITKTYVNEIDISKVKTGQSVKVTIDAFPEKKFIGEVTHVANIGEQLSNSNAKVFEVIINITQHDSIMRPAMTTKNVIETALIKDVLFVPLECVHSNDSLSFVLLESNRKQQVILGKSNENEIIILAGLEKKEELYLTTPMGYEDFSYNLLDKEIIEKYSKKKKKVEKTEVEKVDKQPQKDGRKGGKPSGGKKGGKHKQKQ